MNYSLLLICLAIVLSCTSCAVVVTEPDPDGTVPDTNRVIPDHKDTIKPVTRKTSGCFPFEDNTNRWYYTESGGNQVTILVTDTISDDGITYFRVSFREERVDTTDDWFKRSANSIYFAQSLLGSYNLFLPALIDSARGTYQSGAARASYTYYDSLSIGGTIFHRALNVDYNVPLLHGFTTIVFADSIGIVELVDKSGRWPITYRIDSCSVSGVMRSF
jgi:hypothetical protein